MSSTPTVVKASFLSRVGSFIGKIIKVVATDVAKPVDIASKVAETMFPQFSAEIAFADNLVSNIAKEAIAVEGVAAAAGTATGTGAQKLETVVASVGPAINQWVAAAFPGAKAVSNASQAGLVNAVVAILNEQEGGAVTASASRIECFIGSQIVESCWTSGRELSEWREEKWRHKQRWQHFKLK